MAKDKYHNIVREALIKDGWTITNDPLEVSSIISNFEIDLGAERIIAATKGKEKIAVEVKSFIGRSIIHEFFRAIGQYGFYHLALQKNEPDRTLFLAMPDTAYQFLFKDPNTHKISEQNNIKFIIYNTENKEITSWIIK